MSRPHAHATPLHIATSPTLTTTPSAGACRRTWHSVGTVSAEWGRACRSAHTACHGCVHAASSVLAGAQRSAATMRRFVARRMERSVSNRGAVATLAHPAPPEDGVRALGQLAAEGALASLLDTHYRIADTALAARGLALRECGERRQARTGAVGLGAAARVGARQALEVVAGKTRRRRRRRRQWWWS